MEDGLRAITAKSARSAWDVLILVVVEDGLRASSSSLTEQRQEVLILVLVEDGLRDFCNVSCRFFYIHRLNPCSCGGWSQSFTLQTLLVLNLGVLILVLVEDGLRVYNGYILKELLPCVLILVLVEDGLRDL